MLGAFVFLCHLLAGRFFRCADDLIEIVASSFVFFLKFLRSCEVFNILAEEVLNKMRRRGCCDLFLLKLVVCLHSLRFSGEVKLFLEKNSEFENLLGVKKILSVVIVSCVDM